ncbi:DUF2785 domain-containing protein [Agrilactobacillus fermenti]|uniref:DUF2785 domain-containing protein n=1 Tax=Agrilactobacillus fermenti TaxID=2586909 RepID=UPI001E4ADED5|nr:DUF2785 domain-containing protein [Agrilactobacillus fermenti]MCD2256463.1 DUF2785 domain-containing protein [Agrilactobacillus fermenti]
MNADHEVIQKVSRDLKQSRLQFESGKIFKNLSGRIGHIFDGVVYRNKVTRMDLPEDDEAALARIQAVAVTAKQAGEPVLLDEDLDYLLDHLAALNPQVRDKGVYFLFNDLLHMQAFSDKQLHYVKDTLLSDDFLFYHILEPQNDGVFKRSFSVLILSALLYADRSTYHTFSDAELVAIIDRVTAYIVLEADGRGYIGTKGWGHAYTHVGNVFDEIMASDLNRANKLFFLTVFLQGYRHMSVPLVFGEDHRLAMTFSYLANRDNFFAEYFLTLLKDWQASILLVRPQENEAFWNRWYNRNRLLQALIVRNDFPDAIMDYLNEIVTMY